MTICTPGRPRSESSSTILKTNRLPLPDTPETLAQSGTEVCQLPLGLREEQGGGREARKPSSHRAVRMPSGGAPAWGMERMCPAAYGFLFTTLFWEWEADRALQRANSAKTSKGGWRAARPVGTSHPQTMAEQAASPPRWSPQATGRHGEKLQPGGRGGGVDILTPGVSCSAQKYNPQTSTSSIQWKRRTKVLRNRSQRV